MATLLNLPRVTTSSTDDTSSDPGTPASGISTLSTTAIKDGHEGHHPHTSYDTAAERVARLGGIGSPPAQPIIGNNISTQNKDYFPEIPHTPGASSIATTDGQVTPEGETYGANSTQAKRENMAAVIARRNVDAQNNVGGTANNTTSSVAEARHDAKLIDGMTYDEGDTTAEGLEPLGRRNTLRPGQFTGLEGQKDEDITMED